MTISLEGALSQWAHVVGPENVVTNEQTLEEAERGTFGNAHTIPAIIRPADRNEIQECLRIANRTRTAIYPISSGKNWGYGSRMPAASDCVLMDLGRMNRIVDFSEELSYVSVEPGVTQSQLYNFLRERKSNLWMDSTGSSPECSLIGNTMERGFGHTPYGDHFAHSCGYEVVLPDGSMIETGFGRYNGAHAAPVYRWGVGPTLDGLFSQSNFGIVTRMTIWLMPAPEHFRAYYFSCESHNDLARVINALRPLRMNETIRSASHIANDYKVLGALGQYPWEETGGETPLTRPIADRLRKKLGIGAWTGSGALYGGRAQVREASRLLRRALKGKASRLEFFDDRKLRIGELVAKARKFFTGRSGDPKMAALKPVYGLMKGIPTDHPLTSTYWRKRMPIPADKNPDRDGCGLLWCSPVAPLDGDHAHKVGKLTTDLVLSHGFEPQISMTVLTERALSCIISIAYDRSIPGEDQRARECHTHLLRELARNGYHSYRLGVGSMGVMEDGTGYRRLLAAIKRTLDPNGILAPGRYLPPSEVEEL